MSINPSGSRPALGRKATGKKRVGWHVSREDGAATGDEASDGPSGSALSTPASRDASRDSGDWMIPPYGSEPAPLPFASPRSQPYQPSPRPLDAKELRRALHQAMVTAEEDEESNTIHQGQRQPQTSPEADTSSPSPRVLTPAFKRSTSYNDPRAREEADRAEMQATERQVRAMNDARQRADRLAVSTNCSSSPTSPLSAGSRRSSFDFDRVSSWPPPPSYLQDERDIGLADGGSDAMRYDNVTRRREHSHPEQDAARHLVQSYASRAGNHFAYQGYLTPGTTSGTATPSTMRDYASDYVPQPARYRGGILFSLLRLYHQEGDSERGRRSGFSTPMTSPSTPIPGSPESSPPPTSRRRHYGLHPSSSSLTLTELFKSSSTSSTLRSGDSSDHLVDKLKKKMYGGYKKEKEKTRITVHIADILARHKYLTKLCRALMLYGAPTHRLEEYMTMSSRVLEIEGQFLYMPSCMIISFGDSSTHTTEVKMVRVHQGVDLGRLRDVYNIYKEVVHDKMGVEEATELLDDIMGRKPKFKAWLRVLVYGIASACVAPFAFQGRLVDLPIAFLLGCVVGLLHLIFASSHQLYAHVFEVSAAVITSFLARAFGSIRGGQLFCFSALAQSSIALILPGYMVLCSSLELQSYNLISGSVRMVHALIYTLFLGYGTTIGASLYGMFDSSATSATTCSRPLDHNWNLVFVPAFTLCLCVINQAKWKQTPVMLFISLAGYMVNSYSGRFLVGNGQIANMLGSLTVGVLANLYSRLGTRCTAAWFDVVEWWDVCAKPRIFKMLGRRAPPSVAPDLEASEKPAARSSRNAGHCLAAAAMLPAIFVQVPSGLAAGGSLLAGVDSANKINGPHQGDGGDPAANTFDGTAFSVLFSVVQVAISLSVGLFLSALIVYPLGKRRSGLFSF